jgi:LysM repeat protein
MMVARARIFQGPFTVVVIAGFLAACAGPRAPVGTAGTPYATGASSRVDTIIRNAKQEVTNLRADLGAARIAATKKDVEAEELRRDVTHYRQRLSELQQAGNQQQYAGDKQQQELTALKVEREQLMRDKLDMQRELAELPKLREALAARRAIEGPARVEELEGIIATLTNELAKAKATGSRDDDPSVNDQTSRETPVGATSVSPTQTHHSALSSGEATGKSAAVFVTAVSSIEPSETVVTVKPRDTLWDLARMHGVTIEQLKAGNRLAGDTIHIGQTLRIPSRKQE